MNQRIINEGLSQLCSVTWDGNLISKQVRDWLVERGLAQRFCGWNWLTVKGVEYCETLHILWQQQQMNESKHESIQ